MDPKAQEVTSVSYGWNADEITLIGQWVSNQRVEQRVYNALGHLTVQKGVIWPFLAEAYEHWYTYADGANNGQGRKTSPTHARVTAGSGPPSTR